MHSKTLKKIVTEYLINTGVSFKNLTVVKRKEKGMFTVIIELDEHSTIVHPISVVVDTDLKLELDTLGTVIAARIGGNQ